MKTNISLNAYQVAEIQLSYKSKVKASFRPNITCSQETCKILKQHWDENTLELREEFKLLILNRANKVLGIVNISSGGIPGTVADPKTIFSSALKANGTSIILSHNHPSGNLKPSQADIIT
jgi:DNA repair protein RadC